MGVRLELSTFWEFFNNNVSIFQFFRYFGVNQLNPSLHTIFWSSYILIRGLIKWLRRQGGSGVKKICWTYLEDSIVVVSTLFTECQHFAPFRSYKLCIICVLFSLFSPFGKIFNRSSWNFTLYAFVMIMRCWLWKMVSFADIIRYY